MATRDLKSNIYPVSLLDIQDLGSTDTVSDYVDLTLYESVVFVVTNGTLTGADANNYATITLEESDTTADADFSTVSSDDMIGSFSVKNTTAAEKQFVGYKGGKRYVRVKVDFTGTGITSGYWHVEAIVGNPAHAPASAPATGAAV